MRRNCAIDGHVTVDHDLECVSCGDLIGINDLVGLHFDREHGALGPAASIASIDEWGPSATQPT